MCVDWEDDEWQVAEYDLTAYKFVSKTEDGKYQSPLPVEGRASQEQTPKGAVGKVLTYETGKRVDSDWPGIYLLAHGVVLKGDDIVVLSVTIPKGTKFRRGRAQMKDENGRPVTINTINAMAVIVCKEWHPPASYSWDTNSCADTSSWTSANSTWGYVTPTATNAVTTYSQWMTSTTSTTSNRTDTNA